MREEDGLENFGGVAVTAVDEGFGLGVAVSGDWAAMAGGGFGGGFEALEAR